MTYTKFRILSTAGQIEAQVADSTLQEVAAMLMPGTGRSPVRQVLDSRGNPMLVAAAHIVAVVDGWG